MVNKSLIWLDIDDPWIQYYNEHDNLTMLISTKTLIAE